MSATVTERLINRIAARRPRSGPSRRGFLGGTALLGAALTVDPWNYLTRPVSAYASICGSDNTCAGGYTVFCCTINAGSNTCPPDSFIGGWWKADNSSFCGGSARYYIDCNAYRDGRYTCHCNTSTTTCDQRRVACNQFRYGQCNTQIPYSSTGPVLCRVISCSPPWVQFGGICSGSAATDNNTATHSAPCLSGNQPRGHLDSATAVGNLVTLSGWAYDPDQPATSIRLIVYQDDKALTVITANHSRPDVNAALHISGNHGFSLNLIATTGTHNYKCFAINVGGGSGTQLIGQHNVAVNPGSPPVGRLESATAAGDEVLLVGWAYDRDKPDNPVRLVIYQDGKPLTVTSTTVPRQDVNAAFKITGTHGYRLRLIAKPGLHNYKVYAMNLGGGSGNPLIGNHNVQVGGPGARQLQARPASENSVGLAGSVPSACPVSVAVYQDSLAVHWVDGVRDSFSITVPAGPGVHSYRVDAITADGVVSGLGSRTVAVDHRGTIGELESLDVLGSLLRVSGWAFHPKRAGAPVTISVYRDGALLCEQSTALARPEVNRDYGAAGEPGFAIVLTAEPGPHTYSVYAASLEPGTPASLIGARTIVDHPGAQVLT